MLTEKDLQAIAKVIDERLDQRFGSFDARKLNEKFNMIDKHFLEFERRLDEKLDIKLKKTLRGVARRKDLLAMERRLTKRINYVADHFDEKYLNHESRLGSIETQLRVTS